MDEWSQKFRRARELHKMLPRNLGAVELSEDPLDSREQALHDQVMGLMLRIACPIIWHDRSVPWPKPIGGATCFFLQFNRGIVGVTANHVIEAFEVASASNTNMICQLHTSPPFDLAASVIDRDGRRDLATFAVSEEFLELNGRLALDCRGSWPPPAPVEQSSLTICGFPEHMRTPMAHGVATFEAWGALTSVESISERDILITYDPSRDQPTGSVRRPPVGLNMSGCSGGPALLHSTINGLHRWYPVAIVIAGPRDEGKKGQSADFDMIFLRRIDSIQPDGMISGRTSENGWLP